MSVIALVVATYQTLMTRRALDLTKESLALTRESLDAAIKSMDATTKATELSIRTMQIEMLPSANWVIQVQVALDRWSGDLTSVIAAASAAARIHDAESLHTLALAGLRSPKGLMNRFDVEHTPAWLSTIWLAGAQYYYDAKAPQTALWKEKGNEPWFDFVPELIDRCNESIRGIQNLVKMIEDVVPPAYLNAPASVNDDRFFE